MFSVIDHVMRFAGQRTRSKPSLAAHTPWAGSHGEMGSQVPPALQGLGGLGGSAFCQPGGCVVSSPGNSQGPTVTACPRPQVTRAASACCASCRTTSSRPSPTVATPSSPCPSSGTCEVRAASSWGGRHCQGCWRRAGGGSRLEPGGLVHRVEQTKAGPGVGWTWGSPCQPVATPTPGPFPQDPAGWPGQGLCVSGGELGEEVLRDLFSASEEPGSMCCESQVSVLLGRGGSLVLLLLCYFMYLCIYWAALGLRCRSQVFSSCGKWELLSGCGMWASPWSGFSLLSRALGRTRHRSWGLQALRRVGFSLEWLLVAEPGSGAHAPPWLGPAGSALGLSCCGAWA